MYLGEFPPRRTGCPEGTLQLLIELRPVPCISGYREVTAMKSVILLTAALFLLSAPPPDAADIAEMTANFIVPESVPGSLNADQTPVMDTGASAYSAAPAAARDPLDNARQPTPPEEDQTADPLS
jgi:hypothetical protein